MAGILRIAAVWTLFFAAGVRAELWVTDTPATAMIIRLAVATDDRVVPLMQPGQSPHHWALTPSRLRLLARADRVVITSPVLAAPVVRWLQLQRHDRLLDWSALSGVEIRLIHHEEGGMHASPGHEDHDHETHEEHALHGDPHLWLSPQNVVVLLQTLARETGRDTAPMQRRVRETFQRLRQRLAPWRTTPYLVLHEGFGYFEAEMGLRGRVAVIEPGEGLPMSLKRLVTLRRQLEARQARCLIQPAHRTQRALQTLTRGLAIRVQAVDLLGWEAEDYWTWLETMADAWQRCLAS